MLKTDAALRKDRTTRPTLEHRHFADIARIIAAYTRRADRVLMARHFADKLAQTNSRFDRARFLRACNVES